MSEKRRPRCATVKQIVIYRVSILTPAKKAVVRWPRLTTGVAGVSVVCAPKDACCSHCSSRQWPRGRADVLVESKREREGEEFVARSP